METMNHIKPMGSAAVSEAGKGAAFTRQNLRLLAKLPAMDSQIRRPVAFT